MNNSYASAFHMFTQLIFFYLVGLSTYLLYASLGEIHIIALIGHFSLCSISSFLLFRRISFYKALSFTVLISLLPFFLYNYLDFQNYVFVLFLLISLTCLFLYQKFEKVYYSLSLLVISMLFIVLFPAASFYIMGTVTRFFTKVLLL